MTKRNAQPESRKKKEIDEICGGNRQVKTVFQNYITFTIPALTCLLQIITFLFSHVYSEERPPLKRENYIWKMELRDTTWQMDYDNMCPK